MTADPVIYNSWPIRFSDPSHLQINDLRVDQVMEIISGPRVTHMWWSIIICETEIVTQCPHNGPGEPPRGEQVSGDDLTMSLIVVTRQTRTSLDNK